MGSPSRGGWAEEGFIVWERGGEAWATALMRREDVEGDQGSLSTNSGFQSRAEQMQIQTAVPQRRT